MTKATRTTLIHVKEVVDDDPRREVTTVAGDGERWFTLPNATMDEVVAALRKAGFEERRRPRATRVLR